MRTLTFLVSSLFVHLPFLMIKVLQDDAIKQKDSLLSEVTNLHSELQQARADRDRQLVQSQKLAEEIKKYMENVGKSSQELDILTEKSGSLQVSSKLHFPHSCFIFSYLTLQVLPCRKHVRSKRIV